MSNTPITDATIANDPGDSSYITKLARTCLALEKAANAMEEALQECLRFCPSIESYAGINQALAQYRALKP